MEEIGHPLAHVGTLRDLRSRAWGTLKGYGVKILIIGNGDYLTLEAFNELERSRTNFCIISQKYPRDFGEIGARRTPSPLVILS